MFSLILDSSTKRLYISLVCDDKVLYEKYVEGKNDHAKNIVFLVDEALSSNNISTDDLDQIICGIGPGSYTGVRMAVSVCKMMTVFKNIPLYTISTLKLMASGSKGKVLSYLDARRGNVFGCIIDTNNDYIVQEGLYSFEEIKQNNVDYLITDDNYIVDYKYVLNNKVKVDEPHLLVPNYLRDTEAERNLK